MEELKSFLSEKEFNEYQTIIRKAGYYNPEIKAVSWMGDVFIRALKMLIIPLILSSLISGITNIGTGKNLGRLSLKTISYYISTSFLAIVTGLFFVNIFKPGIGADLNFQERVEGLGQKQQSFFDILVEIVPQNIFQAFTNNEIISIIFFAILFGFFITKTEPAYSEALKKAFNGIFDVMMRITMFITRFTPIGIFGIVAKVIADQNDLGRPCISHGTIYGNSYSSLICPFYDYLALAGKAPRAIKCMETFQEHVNTVTYGIFNFFVGSNIALNNGCR